MLTLLKTYVDMLALRKGPDAVPRSRVILLIAIAMLVVSSVCISTLNGTLSARDHFMSLLGYGLGLLFYGLVLFVSGYAKRMLQTISAIVACGAIITMLYFVEYLLISPLFDANVARLAGQLIILWSVPVEGHIIARAIQQHWFVGIAVAIVALILQLEFQWTFVEQPL